MCESGYYIDDQCMNHVLYADDIYLQAASAMGLQRMLDVFFFYFSTRNDIKFNAEALYVLSLNLHIVSSIVQNARLDCNILENISCSKYLGFITFNMKSNDDDDDEPRQMRTL